MSESINEPHRGTKTEIRHLKNAVVFLDSCLDHFPNTEQREIILKNKAAFNSLEGIITLNSPNDHLSPENIYKIYEAMLAVLLK